MNNEPNDGDFAKFVNNLPGQKLEKDSASMNAWRILKVRVQEFRIPLQAKMQGNLSKVVFCFLILTAAIVSTFLAHTFFDDRIASFVGLAFVAGAIEIIRNLNR